MTKPKSHPLRIDPDAESASRAEPAFVARPKGAPVYHGFPIVPETETDGWYYGAITEFLDPDGCQEGDAYVVAPDGTRAGLVWEVGYDGFDEVCAPSRDRWGVYAVGFVRPVKTMEDLIFDFRQILPDLKRKHEEVAQKKWSPKRLLRRILRRKRL
jgi:hypothetical protein